MKKHLVVSLFALAVILTISHNVSLAGVNEDLMKACAKNDANFAKLAIENGADVNFKDKNGFTPLMLAANFGNTEMVKLLAQKNADLKAESNNGDTALSLAEAKGHAEIVTFLKKRIEKDRPKPEAVEASKEPAPAASEKPAAKQEAKKEEVAPEVAQKMNEDMMRAILRCDLDAARDLINRGADINYQNKSKNTPLLLAVNQNWSEMARFLIERKADVNKTDESGQTAIMVTAAKGNLDIFQLLMQAGADINGKNTGEVTTLAYAAQGGNLNIFEALVAKGADVNCRDKYYHSLLYYLILCGDKATSKTLIKKYYDLDREDMFTTIYKEKKDADPKPQAPGGNKSEMESRFNKYITGHKLWVRVNECLALLKAGDEEMKKLRDELHEAIVASDYDRLNTLNRKCDAMRYVADLLISERKICCWEIIADFRKENPQCKDVLSVDELWGIIFKLLP